MERSLSLTPELVRLCHREVADSGPEPNLAHLDEDDYRAMLDAALANMPPDGCWIFAYGSLIWKPEFEADAEVEAVARGWHRAFHIRLTRWRGTPQAPGLMMGLARGGQCTGVAYRLPTRDLRGQLSKLFRREMTAKPPTYVPKWMNLRVPDGTLKALGFVINPSGRTYAGKPDDEEVAQTLAHACGHVGSGADYLYNTVRSLEARGIPDKRLWRLQDRVAAIIRARHGLSAADLDHAPPQ